MESEDHKKKPYPPPTFTKLTAEPASKLVAHRQSCSEERVADFLNSFIRQQPNKTADQKRKPSA
jgi:hypothetical protein